MNQQQQNTQQLKPPEAMGLKCILLLPNLRPRFRYLARIEAYKNLFVMLANIINKQNVIKAKCKEN